MTDLSKFEALNQRGKATWAERVVLIHEQFPTATRLDWNVALSDIEMMGRLLRDILKLDQSSPGRSGPRPVLDPQKAKARLRQYMQRDYSELVFSEAFRLLTTGRSVRNIAHKTGLDRNMVQKLLSGDRHPDVYIMETVAKAFDKEPGYFLEYRIAYVLGAFATRFADSPEISVDLYKKLRMGR